MKTNSTLESAVVFPDPAHQPDEREVEAVLGPAAERINGVLANLLAVEPAVTMTWQFAKRSGWYQICLLRKRRLFYLLPRHRDFRLSLILGDKAIAQLKGGPFADRAGTFLKTARRYPEGTAFAFDRRTCKPDLMAAFLAAKIAH